MFCHANWAVSVGGVSFPLLADFHPKGELAKSVGLYLEDAGITDRATVIYDADGVVHHSSAVGPGGERNIEELVVLCEELNEAYTKKLGAPPKPAGLEKDVTLYVKSKCGFSLRTLNTRANLHLEDQVKLVNVTEDASAKAKLKELTGKEQAPCLVVDGKPMLESDDITKHLVTKATGYWE